MDLLAAALILSGLLALACGLGDKLSEQAAEDLFEQAVEEAGELDEVEVDVGEQIDISDLPDWLNYPNATATGRMTMTQDEEEGTMYLLQTPDAVSAVVDWYKTALSTWTQSAIFESAEGTQLVYSNGVDQGVQLTVAPETEHTTISCWYFKGQEQAEADEEPAATNNGPPPVLNGPSRSGPKGRLGPGRTPAKGKKIGR